MPKAWDGLHAVLENWYRPLVTVQPWLLLESRESPTPCWFEVRSA